MQFMCRKTQFMRRKTQFILANKQFSRKMLHQYRLFLQNSTIKNMNQVKQMLYIAGIVW
jgi:hypothetical protein